MSESQDEILKKAYYNYSSPSSLSTLQKLKNEVQAKIKSIDNRTLEDFLLAQKTYSLFKKRTSKFPRRHIRIKEKFQTVASDLISMESLQVYNKNYRWILCSVDLTSNMIHLIQVKQKTSANMIEAFKQLISFAKSHGGKIEKLWTDRGQEFISCKTFLASQGISIYHTTTGLKSSQAERMIREAKGKLYRIMIQENNFDWLSHLQSVQKAYNTTKQPGKLLGHSPMEVVNDEKLELKVRKNYAQIMAKRYKMLSTKAKDRYPPLHVGSLVRHIVDRGIFLKQYLPQFSDEIEKVVKCHPTVPKTFTITNSGRRWYRQELSLTTSAPQKELFKVYETREVAQRVNRSGKKSNFEKEYLIGDLNSKQKKHWISGKELEKLDQDGLIFDSNEQQ